MPKNQFVNFKAIKMAVTMRQILDLYRLTEKFKQSGDSLSGACPIHKGSNPTQFRVSISKNVWNCFSDCKSGGNVLDFIARMENISIHAAALKAIEWFELDPGEMVAEKEGAPIQKETAPKKEAENPRPNSAPAAPENSKPNSPLKFRLDKLDQAHPYLVERGLTPETIHEFGLGFCSKGTLADHIAIPIQDSEGRIVAYAGRWPGEPPEETPKYKLPLGFRKSLELFNIHRALKEPPEKPLIIIEGFFGTMKLHQFGCRKVVALMGSTMSAAQEELIRKNTNRKSHVIVMLDENEAGQTGREDIALRVSKFAFVHIHEFTEKDKQPEHMTAEEVAQLSE